MTDIREKRLNKKDGKNMGRSTTEEIAGEPDVANSQFMLPWYVQGGVVSVHEPIFY